MKIIYPTFLRSTSVFAATPQLAALSPAAKIASMTMLVRGLILVLLLLRRLPKVAMIAAIATAAIATSSTPAAADTFTTYEVSGTIGACVSASDDICPGPATPQNFQPTLPVFGAFSFGIDVGGAGYPTGAAVQYFGGPDLNSSFTELLGSSPTIPPFSIDATYPVPGNDGFPGFDVEDSVIVSYCPAGTCGAGAPPTDSGLLVTISLLNNAVASLDLYYQSGTPVTGTLDPAFSSFEIETTNPQLTQTYYAIDSASVGPVSIVPEPSSVTLLGIPLIWLFWRKPRA